MNRGAIPTINDAWQEVLESQIKHSHAKALKYYQKEMKAYI